MSYSDKTNFTYSAVAALICLIIAFAHLSLNNNITAAQTNPTRTPTQQTQTVPARTSTPTRTPTAIMNMETPIAPSQELQKSFLPIIFSEQSLPTITPTFTPTSLLFECSIDAYNCSDFSSQAEAQSVFDYCFQLTGIDIHRLDENNNQIACEPTPTPLPLSTATSTSVPQPTSTPTPSITFVCSSDFYNCGDFSTQAEAQQVHDYCQSQGAGDIHRLDRDGNGLACESLPRSSNSFRLDLANISRP